MNLTQLQLPFLEFKKAEEERTKIKPRSKINQISVHIGFWGFLTAMTVFSLKTLCFMFVERFTPKAFTFSATDHIYIPVIVIFFGLYFVAEIIDSKRIKKTIGDDDWCYELHCMWE